MQKAEDGRNPLVSTTPESKRHYPVLDFDQEKATAMPCEHKEDTSVKKKAADKRGATMFPTRGGKKDQCSVHQLQSPEGNSPRTSAHVSRGAGPSESRPLRRRRS